MAWVKTNETQARRIQTTQILWVNVQEAETGWDVMIYAPNAGQFVISNHASQQLAETALDELVATW